MTSSAGRKTVAYLVKCALTATDSLVKQDQTGVTYTFAGGLGLCPAWKNGGISALSEAAYAQCVESLSACMIAHVNTAGVHVPLWLDSPDSAIGWGVDRVNYPMQEGTFFGDIMDTGVLNSTAKPQVTGPVAYYCDGAGFPSGASGIVAGRLGANQSGAPYTNPFGMGSLCQTPTSYGAPVNTAEYSMGVTNSCPSGSVANPAGGCPDGYKQMQYPYTGVVAPWTHPITVWRNNSYTPVFDTTYRYTMSALVTKTNPMVVDVGTSPIQQWNQSAGLSTSVFAFAQAGSNWTISPNGAPQSCLDAGAGVNGTGIVVNSCAGGASQSWTISANAQTGAFVIKSVATGRCMSVRGGSTTAGAIIEVDDCVSGSTVQQFNIQAK